MIVYEEGISNRSFAIFAVANVLGFGSLVWFLQLSKTTPTWLQLIFCAITLSLLAVGFAAWMGKFDKKEVIKAPIGYEPRHAEPMAEMEATKKVKLPPKEDWAKKWLKENKQ